MKIYIVGKKDVFQAGHGYPNSERFYTGYYFNCGVYEEPFPAFKTKKAAKRFIENKIEYTDILELKLEEK